MKLCKGKGTSTRVYQAKEIAQATSSGSGRDAGHKHEATRRPVYHKKEAGTVASRQQRGAWGGATVVVARDSNLLSVDEKNEGNGTCSPKDFPSVLTHP